MNSGYICLYRQIQEHWIWQDATKLKWWIDILLTVNHSDQKINIGFKLYDCARGQTIKSLTGWATRWNVSKDCARHFLKLLEKDNMITHENLGKTTRITVCNYDSYQITTHDKQPKKTRKPNDDRPQAGTNNNDNNVKNDLLITQKSDLEIKYEKFNTWLTEYAPDVLLMKEPITLKQFIKLYEDGYFENEIVYEKLKAMHNKLDLLKKYKSANGTLKNWVKREDEKTSK